MVNAQRRSQEKRSKRVKGNSRRVRSNMFDSSTVRTGQDNFEAKMVVGGSCQEGSD